MHEAVSSTLMCMYSTYLYMHIYMYMYMRTTCFHPYALHCRKWKVDMSYRLYRYSELVTKTELVTETHSGLFAPVCFTLAARNTLEAVICGLNWHLLPLSYRRWYACKCTCVRVLCYNSELMSRCVVQLLIVWITVSV